MCTKVLLLLPLILCYFVVASGSPLGGACTHSFNCTSTITDSECISLTCQCTGTHFQQNNMCASKITLGSPCNVTTPCYDENASCTNTCTCHTAFYPDTTCKPRIHPNMTCGNSTPKNVSCVANAYCDSTNICVCSIGYTATTTSCNSAVTMSVVEMSTMIMCFVLAYFEVLK